jgi:phytanoyl-CoA hydroxylase
MSITTAATAPTTRNGLTTSEVAHWRIHGWVAVPDFLCPDEVAILRQELAALQTAGLLRNVHTTGDGETRSSTAFNLQICPVGPHSRPIRALAYAGKVRTAAIDLLGDSAVQQLDQIFLKPAQHGVGTGWHTDNAYFRSAAVEAGTGMWIALHDAHRANGTMRILPGSHRRDLPHVRDGASDHHITCAASVDETESLTIELPAGGALFFNYGIAHATGANSTMAERAGLALHFVQEAQFNGGGAKSSAEAWKRRVGADGDGGCAAHGEDLRGVWESLVSDFASSY